MIPHKHADLIKAWADGAEIQFRDIDGLWVDIEDPSWSPMATYRIKPKKKKVYIVGPEDDYKLLRNINSDQIEYVHLKHTYQLQGIENPEIIWQDVWFKYVDSPFDFLEQVMLRTRDDY